MKNDKTASVETQKYLNRLTKKFDAGDYVGDITRTPKFEANAPLGSSSNIQ